MIRYSLTVKGKTKEKDIPYDPMDYGFELKEVRTCCFVFENSKVQLTIKKDLQGVKVLEKKPDGTTKSRPVYASLTRISKKQFEKDLHKWL
jgi:hypothetical protein